MQRSSFQYVCLVHVGRMVGFWKKDFRFIFVQRCSFQSLIFGPKDQRSDLCWSLLRHRTNLEFSKCGFHMLTPERSALNSARRAVFIRETILRIHEIFEKAWLKNVKFPIFDLCSDLWSTIFYLCSRYQISATKLWMIHKWFNYDINHIMIATL